MQADFSGWSRLFAILSATFSKGLAPLHGLAACQLTEAHLIRLQNLNLSTSHYIILGLTNRSG